MDEREEVTTVGLSGVFETETESLHTASRRLRATSWKCPQTGSSKPHNLAEFGDHVQIVVSIKATVN